MTGYSLLLYCLYIDVSFCGVRFASVIYVDHGFSLLSVDGKLSQSFNLHWSVGYIEPCELCLPEDTIYKTWTIPSKHAPSDSLLLL
jgi:hypothetical protein